jgi:tetratricopeptide (TPR) repeat protein
MKIIFYIFSLLIVAGVSAQKKKTSVPTMPDVNALMKMSPAELEAYKQKMIKQASQQAEDYSDANGLAINKTLIPGYEPKPPVKDIKRLNLLPSQPPTRAQLVSSLQQSAQQIQKGIPAPKVQEIEKFTASNSVETINEKAIADFYSDDPKGAILMMVEMSAKVPDSLLYLNNLGSMLNIHGGQHRAIPIFQYCLQREPNSSILLNNIGQSFMGLGDLLKAADYFNKCLSIDSLNVEANHSMGLLHYFKKEYDAAMKCFERELSMAYRRSTMAMAYKMGKKFNLREIAKRRNSRSGRPEKDFLEEITLGKFSPPQLPKTTEEILQRKAEFDSYLESVGAEMMYWLNLATQTSITPQNPNAMPGLYSDLADAMLEELHKEFTPAYLSLLSDDAHEKVKESIETLSKKIIEAKCPPTPPGVSIEAGRAYEIKCCEELHRPLADKMVTEVAGQVQPALRKGILRWKSYINQLVAIAQLEPNASKQSTVYHAVSAYFKFLAFGTGFYTSGEVRNLIPSCSDAYVPAALDTLLEADRKWRMDCPPWLNIEVDFEGMVVKADCNKYVIEAGSTIMGAFEHEFKSGKSTLLIGPGIKGNFGPLAGEIKTQAFITFDNNKQFSDFGLKQTAEGGLSGAPIPIGPRIKFGGNLAGVEISRQISIISGTDEASMELKGAATLIPKDFFNWD